MAGAVFMAAMAVAVAMVAIHMDMEAMEAMDPMAAMGINRFFSIFYF